MNNHEPTHSPQKQDDPASDFSAVYKKYFTEIYRFLLKRLGDKEEAQDLAQETFARAYRYRHNYSYRGYNYNTYLYTVARRLLSDHYRKRPVVKLDDLEMEQKHHTAHTPEKIALRREAWRTIEQLRPQEKEILKKKYLEGKSVREIAQETGKSENAVKLTLSRGRERIRQKMDFRPRRHSN